jgi:hypothetical protein
MSQLCLGLLKTGLLAFDIANVDPKSVGSSQQQWFHIPFSFGP